MLTDKPAEISKMNAIKSRTAVIATAAAMLGLFLTSAQVNANEKSAQMAIGQASAKVDLVAKQGAAATNHPSFLEAQRKMQAAEAAYKKNDDQEAEWRANEASVYAEIALEASQLEALKANRQELENSVRLLRSESQH
jgi:hypothetical protein